MPEAKIVVPTEFDFHSEHEFFTGDAHTTTYTPDPGWYILNWGFALISDDLRIGQAFVGSNGAFHGIVYTPHGEGEMIWYFRLARL